MPIAGRSRRGAAVLDVDADHRRELLDTLPVDRRRRAHAATELPPGRGVLRVVPGRLNGSWRDELTQDQRIRASTPVLRRCGEFEPSIVHPYLQGVRPLPVIKDSGMRPANCRRCQGLPFQQAKRRGRWAVLVIGDIAEHRSSSAGTSAKSTIPRLP